LSDFEKELELEQRRVEVVMEVIDRSIAALEDQSGGLHGEIVSIKREFWDDVTVNLEDAAETAETFASLKQQAEVLSERERSYQHAKQQLITMKKLKQSPYFGRVDFKEQEDPQTDTIYLGIGSLLDDSGERYLVYDWRAPVSSLYYDFGPGPVLYETPSGTVQGEMSLKRQYIIRGSNIRSMFDTGVTIGDELLQEVLGKQSDAQMKSIVATIQREQNAIIRNERAKMLIVQGAAGSGKTSAALQRVAYLLYRYRDSLNASQIILFSPNPMFNSYISAVLPELGEQNMGQTTYQQYLEHRLGRHFTLEDPFQQMEYTLTEQHDPAYAARLEAIAYKSSRAYMKLIDDYVNELGDAGIIFKPIKFRGRILVTAEQMDQYFYGLSRQMSIANRLRETAGWLLKELTRLAKAERRRKWVEEEMELLDVEQYVEAYEKLLVKNKFDGNSFDDFQSERDYLSAMVVQERFKRLRSAVKQLKFIDMTAMYIRLLQWALEHEQAEHVEGERFPAQWSQISENSIAHIQNGSMYNEDATPYLYLKEKLEGFHTNTSVKHVFIDEAQDYSAFQLHFLKRIFPMSKMTVLGDINQSIFAHTTGDKGLAPYSELFPEEETLQIELLRSYRSTRPIVEFTSKMISGGERIQPFNRAGKQPELFEMNDGDQLELLLLERLQALEKEGYESLALICKTAEESERLYSSLRSSISNLKLIQKETVVFEKGIVVIPVYLAKGVEFDAVIIPDASAERYGRESDRRLFYTACTRAMHELFLYYTNERSPFIKI